MTWKYTPTIMDGPVVRFDFTSFCEVNASRNGVSIDGQAPVMKEKRLKEFHTLLGQAFEAHLAITEAGDHDAAQAWVEKQNLEIKQRKETH
jgi:hypothetical protein